MTTTQSSSRAARRYSRVSCNAAAVMVTGAATFSGVCHDLSIGGAGFKGSEVPAEGTVTLTLCLPSMGPVEITGEVCHAELDRCGVRFTTIPREAFSAICAYVGATGAN